MSRQLYHIEARLHLKTENAILRELLRKLEWVEEGLIKGRWCLICGAEQHHGHAPNCKLAEVEL